MSQHFTLREAVPEDATAIARLVRELAAYENLSHESVATEDDFRRHLFGEKRYAQAILAEQGGRAVGLALWFHNFSTFTGKPGLYIEDLYVDPAARGRGIGRALFRWLARRALEDGCARMEWAVLDWNAPALGFYRSVGARSMHEWTVHRLSGPSLLALATEG
jgi:GNAT superfamily N-acetyltransferase